MKSVQFGKLFVTILLSSKYKSRQILYMKPNDFVCVHHLIQGTNLLSDLLVKNCYIPEKTKKYGPDKIGMRGKFFE